MFTVFHKMSGGRLEWIGAAETQKRAKLMARMWSRYGNTEVVVMKNDEKGKRHKVASYIAGELVERSETATPEVMTGVNSAQAMQDNESIAVVPKLDTQGERK